MAAKKKALEAKWARRFSGQGFRDLTVPLTARERAQANQDEAEHQQMLTEDAARRAEPDDE